MNIVIRQAIVDDVTAMDELLGGLAEFLGEPGLYTRNPDVLRRYGFGQDKLFDAIVAYVDTDPAGLSIYFPEFSTWRGQPGVYVQDLYVTPAQRGSGLGQKLIAHTLRHAADSWQAGYIRLSVDRYNDSAIRFYRRLGFEIDQENLILKMETRSVERLTLPRTD